MSEPAWPSLEMPDGVAELGRYVLPDEVARLIQLPQRLRNTRLVEPVWEQLRNPKLSGRIRYASAAAKDGHHGQWIRTPYEVLVAPGSGTCIDVACVLAAGWNNAGLDTALIILQPAGGGQVWHVLVAATSTTWPDGLFNPESWDPKQLADNIGTAPGQLLVANPVGITHPTTPATKLPGTDTTLEDATADAVEYLSSGDWVIAAIIDTDEGERYRPRPDPAVLPLRDLFLPLDRETVSPLQALRPEYRLTGFINRDETVILDDLRHQTLEAGRNQIVAIGGVGGAGKTRLALETAEKARQEGWYVGVLAEHLPDTALEWLSTVHAPLLVIVDYADGRLADLRNLLHHLTTRRNSAPTLIILTARTLDGTWLAQLEDDTATNHNQISIEELPLPESHPNPKRIYQATLKALRQVTAREPQHVPGVEWTTLDLVLLAWLDSHQNGSNDTPASKSGLYKQVMNHELRAWCRYYNDILASVTIHQQRHTSENQKRHATADRKLLATAGALVTLLQPHEDDVDETLSRLRQLASDFQWRSVISRTFVAALQPRDGERLAIRPDPVGDHHLLTTLSKQPKLIENAVTKDTTDQQVFDAVWTLNRAGQNDLPAATQLIEQLLLQHPHHWHAIAAVANSIPGAARDALQHLVDMDIYPDDLERLSERITAGPLGATRLGLSIAQQRLNHAHHDPQSRATLLLSISQNYHDLGNRANALEAVTEAVELCRVLAESNPSAFTSSLASSLNNLSNQRSNTGDRTGAVQASTEATTLYRALAQADPAAFTPDFAAALNNLSNQRLDIGDRTGALEAVTESTTLYRALAQADPAAFAPGFAAALNTLSIQLSAAGDRTGALQAITEATGVYRHLTQTDPAAFTPGLAMSLNNLSNQRGNSGDRTGALECVTEATTLYRALARANPAAFTPHLATSLITLSIELLGTGDRTGALQTITEATGVYRHLTQTDPAAFTPGLAMSLNNLSTCLSNTGDRDGALEAITEATTLYRALAQADPAAFTPDLAGSLNNLSNRRSDSGDRNGALQASTESATLYRALTQADPVAFTPNLAGSLNNLSIQLNATGDRTGALQASTESTTLYRALTQAEPAAFTPDLASALNTLATQLSATGDRTGALQASTEATTLYRALTQTDPAAFTPDLAAVLNNLSNRRSDSGDRTGALEAITEAVELRRLLAQADPAAFTLGLAMALNNLSNQRSDSGDRTGALEAIIESSTLYRALAQADPAAFTPDLAAVLNNLSNRRGASGDRDGALEAITETVELRRVLAQSDPAAFIPDLAMALYTLSTQLSATGDRTGAVQAITESTTLYRDLTQTDPAAFTPILATATRLMADLVDHGSEVWTDSVDTAPDPHKATLLLAAKTWHTKRGQHSGHLLDAAVRSCEHYNPTVALSMLSTLRKTVRDICRDTDKPTGSWPTWVTCDIPTPSIDVANAWRSAAGPGEKAQLLKDLNISATNPCTIEAVQTLSFLYPGYSHLEELQEVLHLCETQGVRAVISQLESTQQALDHVRAWISTETWAETASYLALHQADLDTQPIRTILQQQQDPTFATHLALLDLAAVWGVSTVEQQERLDDIVTDPHHAADEILRTFETADFTTAFTIINANPDALGSEPDGPFIHIVLMTATDPSFDGIEEIRALRKSSTPTAAHVCQGTAVSARRRT